MPLDRSDRPATGNFSQPAQGLALSRGSSASQDTPTTKRKRHTLGLPPGSVRALLALMVVAVTVVTLARKQELSTFWSETLLIALAHYFTSRKSMDLSPRARALLEKEGILQDDGHPLHLPKNSIRGVIVFAFVSLAFYLSMTSAWTMTSGSMIAMIFAYLTGIMGKNMFRDDETSEPNWAWEDSKAIITLLALGLIATGHLTGNNANIPTFLENVTLGLVLFYLGSR